MDVFTANQRWVHDNTNGLMLSLPWQIKEAELAFLTSDYIQWFKSQVTFVE